MLFTKWASLRGVVEETAKTCKYDKFKTLKYKSADVKYTVYIQVRSSEVDINLRVIVMYMYMHMYSM